MNFGVVGSLADVDRDEWDGLVSASNFYLSYDWLRGQERSPAARASYATVRDPVGRLCAGVPVYEFRAPVGPRHPAVTGRRLLWVGARTGYRTEFPTDAGAGALGRLIDGLHDLAAERGYDGLLVPYLDRAGVGALGLSGCGGSYFLHDAEARWEADGSGQFLDGRRAKLARKDARRFATTGLTVGVRPLSDVRTEVAPLLRATMAKYGADVPEREIHGFLAEQARTVDDRSVVFCCLDESSRIVGCSIDFRWRDRLYARVAGFRYDELRDGSEYFECVLYAPARYAADRRLTAVHLGTTALEAKSRRGAVVAALWTAVLDRAARPLDADRTSQEADRVRHAELSRGVDPSRLRGFDDPRELW